MWVFVDVDGTLIDQNDNPRPHILEFFLRLKYLGCTVVVWSAGGAGYAENKFNMIENKLNWYSPSQYSYVDIRSLVTAYLWKQDWTDVTKNIQEKQFYVDDESALLEIADERGYGTFKVPFYQDPDEVDIAEKDDKWLLRAAEAIERAMYGTVHGSINRDDGDSSSET